MSEQKGLINSETRLIPLKEMQDNSVRYVAAFPDYYQYGLPNIGMQTIYRECNSHPNVVPDRYYLCQQEWSEKALTWERSYPVKDAHILGFSLSYEGSYMNFLQCLEDCEIPLLAEERDSSFPLVIAGGVTVMYNPLPLADFVDLFILGEGENVIHNILDIYIANRNNNKRELLKSICEIRGIFVPSLMKDANVEQVVPVDILNLPAHSIFLSDKTVYGEKTFSIEVRRGCNQKCRFCYMGTRLRPARTVSFEAFKRVVDEGLQHCDIIKCFYEGLDTNCIEKYLSYIEERGGRLRIGSQRLEMLSENIIEMMARAGQRKLVIAPETSTRLRKVIGKERILNDDILKYIDIAAQKGIWDIGLYFIVGLPGETADDLMEIVSIISMVRDHMNQIGNFQGYLEVGVNPLYPKPFTALQYAPATFPEVAEEKISYIINQLSDKYTVVTSNEVVDEKVEKRTLNKNDNSVIKFETTVGDSVTFYQPLLSRGDERMGKVLLEMRRQENTIENWKNALHKNGLLYSDYFREYLVSERLPWSFQKTIVTEDHLKVEYQRAHMLKETKPCLAKCGECEELCIY